MWPLIRVLNLCFPGEVSSGLTSLGAFSSLWGSFMRPQWILLTQPLKVETWQLRGSRRRSPLWQVQHPRIYWGPPLMAFVFVLSVSWPVAVDGCPSWAWFCRTEILSTFSGHGTESKLWFNVTFVVIFFNELVLYMYAVAMILKLIVIKTGCFLCKMFFF